MKVRAQIKNPFSIMKYIFSLLFLVSIVSCIDNEKDRIENANPGAFQAKVSGITDVSAHLSWTAAKDPDGDEVTYSVRINDKDVSKTISDTEFSLNHLTYSTLYFVEIIANDGKGGKSSSSFKFITAREKAVKKHIKYVIPDAEKSYYKGINFSVSSKELFNELSNLVSGTHTRKLSYTPGVWETLKKSDLSPQDHTKVILIYGYNDEDDDYVNDRTRGVNDNGGKAEQWNREHVYAKSLAVPKLDTDNPGPGTDAHNLRPSDVKMNADRGSLLFTNGSGYAHKENKGWYPGNEWKGDVARIIMYMYLHYGKQCYPTNIGYGSRLSSDSHMIDLFIKWNAEDPVSTLEKQRNDAIYNAQGNRNPFIDNPNLATAIWGGKEAKNLWK